MVWNLPRSLLPVELNTFPLVVTTQYEGKAANRRTRIVILPQLDQFFKLLEKSLNRQQALKNFTLRVV